MSLAERHRRFTVDEYHRMAEAGILHEDDRVELLDGEIVEMTPIGNPHGACVDRLNRLLVWRAGDRAIVRIQGPVRLSTDTELQPDVTLLRFQEDFYATRPPGPGDVLLVVEVADTSLGYDAGVKTAAYARAGVPEVWIVDLTASEILVRREPAGETYRIEQTRHRGDPLEVEAVPGLTFAVDEVLPH